MAYIQEVRRPLIKELHGLIDHRIGFELSDSKTLLAHIQAKANLAD